MIDRYTKAVLTVIAGALITLAIQNAVPNANAQQQLSSQFGVPPAVNSDVCGAPGHPCQVTWTTPMPVTVVTPAQ